MSCAAKTPNIEHTRNNSLFAKFEFPPPWQTTRQVFHHLVFSIDQSRGTSHLHSGEGRNIRLSAKWTRMGTSRARQPFGSQVVHSTVRFYHREWERKSCGLTMGGRAEIRHFAKWPRGARDTFANHLDTRRPIPSTKLTIGNGCGRIAC